MPVLTIVLALFLVSVFLMQLKTAGLPLSTSYLPATGLTAQWLYQAGSWNLLKMLSATFIHHDQVHLLINLLQFLLFAGIVEQVLGRKKFICSYLILTFASYGVYSLVYTALSISSESLGLSGVSMGMMTLASVIMLKNKLLWLPHWLLVLNWALLCAFLVLNIYMILPGLAHEGHNIVSHTAGAIAGVWLGLRWSRKQNHRQEQSNVQTG